MFKCDECKAHTVPGEKMTRIAREARRKEYVEDGRVVGRGYETVREARCCEPCAARLVQQGFRAT